MRSLYFTAAESGRTRAELRHGEATGRWVKVGRANYRFGSDPVSELDECLAPVAAAGGTAHGQLAGVLLGLDAVRLAGPEQTLPVGSSNARAGVRRRDLPWGVIEVAGFPCTSALQTLIDLAGVLDDLRWEQALESALRKKLVTIAELEGVLDELSRRRERGVSRIRRVLDVRPNGAPPTGSILETMFVQLRRRVPGSTEPLRQVEVRDEHGQFVAFVDFAWPELGLFIELDGEHHAGQPVHDARRETAVVAATGWLVGRFTWTEVHRYPVVTARRLEALLAQAAARPVR
jgi:very-short-patch-repair endonuclease